MAANGKVSRRYLRKLNGKPTKVLIGGKAVPKGIGKSDVVPLASLRRCELEAVFRHRYGKNELPDDDAGRADAELMLHHLAHREVADPVWLMNLWLDDWAPWMSRDDRASIAAQVVQNPLKFGADTIAHRLGNFTDAERTLLGLKTIGSVDVDAKQRKVRRKRINTEQKAASRRRNGAIPRDQWLAQNSANRNKPWKADGISKATYYRDKKAAEASRRPYTADGPVSRISYAEVTITAI